MLEEKWSEALEKYTLAIDGAMRVLANERDTPRATKLGQQVSGWLTTAQRLQVPRSNFGLIHFFFF